MQITKMDIVRFLEECEKAELERMDTYAKQARLFSGEPANLLKQISLEEKGHAEIVRKMINKIAKDVME